MYLFIQSHIFDKETYKFELIIFVFCARYVPRKHEIYFFKHYISTSNHANLS